MFLKIISHQLIPQQLVEERVRSFPGFKTQLMMGKARERERELDCIEAEGK